MQRQLRILLIESDKVVAELMRATLSDAGYAVEQQSEALRPFPACDLVIANAPTPRRVADWVRALRVETTAPVLLVSARFHRSAQASTEIAHRLGVRGVLGKPFTASGLLQAVQSAVAGPPAF